MKKLLSLVLAAGLLLALLAGCAKETAQDPAQEPDQKPAQLEKIVITEPIRGYLWAPVQLADTLGYFEEAGLDVEFQTVTGADASAPVFSGDAQFGIRGVEMALQVTEGGQNCKILFSTTTKYPYALMGASADYSTLDSLKGGAIAGGMGATSSPNAWSRACLISGGLDPAEDVEVLSNMPSTGFVAAMQNGDLQGAVATNAWVGKMMADYGAVTIMDGTDPATAQEVLGSDKYELAMLFATDAYIKENPETVQKVVTAVAKAAQWMETATAQEIADSLVKLYGEDSAAELLYSAQDAIDRDMVNFTGYHTPEGFQAAIRLTKLSGAITGDQFTEEQIYDESFLDAAWETLG